MKELNINDQIIQLRKEELTIKEIANKLSVTYDKVRYVLDKNKMQEFKYKRVCKCCNKSFETVRSSAVFCSDKCRVQYNKKHKGHERLCKHCGKTFFKYKEQDYCSAECFHNYLNENKKPKAEYIPKPKHIKMCINCNKEYETKQSRSKYCSYECNYEYKVKQKPIHNLKCKECGKWFTSTNQRRKYCSTKCSNRYEDRRKETLRRLRIKENGKVDWDISIERLIKRDKGICYLCGKHVDIRLEPNHDLYPSIEHVVPVAKGGMHTWENVKLAHRKCNYLKSDEII